MRLVFLCACLLLGVGTVQAQDQAYFIYGNRCAQSQDGKPPICQLIGWPADSPEAAFQELPWTYQPGKKADKLSTQPATVAKADAR